MLEYTIPVLEPDLNRPLSHVDFIGNSFTDSGGRCGVVVEFHLQSCQLILGGALSLLVLLLLSESALARGSSRSRVTTVRRGRGRLPLHAG